MQSKKLLHVGFLQQECGGRGVYALQECLQKDNATFKTTINC